MVDLFEINSRTQPFFTQCLGPPKKIFFFFCIYTPLPDNNEDVQCTVNMVAQANYCTRGRRSRSFVIVTDSKATREPLATDNIIRDRVVRIGKLVWRATEMRRRSALLPSRHVRIISADKLRVDKTRSARPIRRADQYFILLLLLLLRFDPIRAQNAFIYVLAFLF